MKYLTLLLFLIIGLAANAQFRGKTEIYAGVSYSNINPQMNGHQVVRFHPVNGPNFRPLPHLGVSWEFLKYEPVNLQIGLSLAGRGAKNEAHVVAPIDTISEAILLYIHMPITFNFRLLDNKDIFFSAGLLPGYLLGQSEPYKDAGLPVFVTAYPFQLDFHLGVRAGLSEKFATRVSFTRGFFSIDHVTSNFNYLKDTKINISFDLSLIYRL